MTNPLSGRARRRLLGAAWFAVWGSGAAGVIYFPAAVDQGVFGIVLLILLPGVAAACAGAVVGPAVLDPERAGGAKSIALGLGAALLAHLVFAPLFAASFWITDPGHTGFLGSALATAVYGPLMTGIVTLPLGALAGWLLFRVGRGLR